MQKFARVLSATLVLAVAGACAEKAPTSPDSDLLVLAPDLALSATQGQASEPGFTMSPEPTFSGSTSTDSPCAFNAATGRVECTPITRGGLTITRSYAFYDAAGVAQSHRDSLTRSVNTRVKVTGAITVPMGSLSVDRNSSITVSGLGKTSTSHTINGQETGTVSGEFTTASGHATVSTTFTSATNNVVVPAPFTATSWPVSGTNTHSATTTASRGSDSRTSQTSQTVTYNGTSVVPVVITVNGQTRNCTRNLATHTQSCS